MLLSTGEGWLKDGPEIDEVVCKLFSQAPAQEAMVMGFRNAANLKTQNSHLNTKQKYNMTLQCFLGFEIEEP